MHVEPKQMQVLVQLVEHAGTVVSKERLLQTVWADTFVGDEVLSRAISELRRLLEDDRKAPRYIQTIPKSGYRLIAPVRTQERAVAAAEPEITTPIAAPSPPAWRRALVVGVLAPLATMYVVWKIADAGVSTSEPSSAQTRTVALTTLPGAEGAPSFSPDGTHIVFASSPGAGQGSRIVVKNIGDNPPHELTSGARDGSPAWSPDGHSIAFVRNGWPAAGAPAGYVAASGLYVMPVLGGPPRRVFSGSLYGGPAWSPDGRTLVFAPELPRGGANLIALSLATMETRLLTSGEGWDDFPVFSPDGQTVAFVRDVASARDMYVVPARGGTPRRLTFDDLCVWGRPAWTPDGGSLIYASSRAGSADLWRIAAGGGQPERLSIAGDAYGVALDRTGRRLAYVKGRDIKLHIAAFDLEDPRRLPVNVAESTHLEHSPSFSRDGKKIAFRSDRGGGSDIWIADADGRNPTRLTFSKKGFNGSPQWSPDGERIAFDGSTEQGWHIFAVRTAGGLPVQLTAGRSNQCVPTRSRDGRWIYFVSDRTGQNQI